MERKYICGVEDVLVVSDPAEMRSLSGDQRVDRYFLEHTPVLNGLLLGKILRVFSLGGRRFPTMLPSTDARRAAAQDALWSRLNERAAEAKLGPQELEPMARWVRGAGAEDEIGPLVQQSVGRLFVEGFVATKESWAAARTIAEAAGSANSAKMLWWRVTGKVERAKALLAAMVGGDLAAVNGIGVALHHIVDGLHKMRGIYADAAVRSSMTAGGAADECLFAPGSVVRQATAEGEVGGCPFRKGSVFVLELEKANSRENRDLVFLSKSWSRCPAEQWVPALLEGVWRRAVAMPSEA